ncbi:MAG: hypothetical protein K2I80_05950 [Ruminococcus sp.]|nr:hypothetical protein [Ruminococcus sp.]
MSVCQVYLYEEQKKFLLKYICERRFNVIMSLWSVAIIFAVMFLLLMLDSFTINETNIEGILIMIMSVVAFIKIFVDNFGKTFGFNCDKKCIENDWYTITCGKFVYRDKNTRNRHPYYISDQSYNQYICPRFLEWRNADENTMFLYIRLENGRGYAIADN